MGSILIPNLKKTDISHMEPTPSSQSSGEPGLPETVRVEVSEGDRVSRIRFPK